MQVPQGFKACVFVCLSEHDQKLIRPGKTENELAHQIWNQIPKRFVQKCLETAWPIRGGGNWIQWSVTIS